MHSFRLFSVALLLTAMGCSEPQASPLRNGDALMKAGRVKEAIGQYETLLKQERNPQALRGLGLAHQYLWQWDRSLDYLSEAAELAPSDPVVRVALAMALAATRQPQEARQQADWLVKNQSALGSGQLMLALLASTEAQAAQARDALELFHKQPDGKKAEVALALADLAKRRGNATAADKFWAQARSLPLADAAGATRLAFLYGRLGRFAPAERLLMRVVEAEPKRLEAQRQLAHVAVERDHFERAQKALQALPEAQRNAPGLALVRGRILLGQEDSRGALPLLKAAVARLDAAGRVSPKGVQMRTLMAQAMGGAGDLKGARSELQALVDGGDAPADTRLTLVDVKLRLGDDGAAVEDLQAMLKDGSTRAAALEILGKVHMDKGRPKAAVEAFGKLVQLAPESAQALHFYAGALRAAGDDGAAIVWLERCLKLEPQRVSALGALLSIHVKAGREAVALKLLQEQLDLHPESAAIHGEAGRFHLGAGRTDQARGALEKAMALDPAYLPARALLARMARDGGDTLKAAALYEQILVDAPNYPPALLGAGETRHALGAHAAAQKHFETLVRAAPQSATALNNLAYVLARDPEQLDQALAMARRAQALTPDSAESADTLGWVLHLKGQNEEALPLLRVALKGLPKAAAVHFHLGMTELALGDTRAGGARIKRALELDSQFEGADVAREALAR